MNKFFILFLILIISIKSFGQNKVPSKFVMLGVSYSEKLFKELSENGITHIHTYSLSTDYRKEDKKIKEYLSLAEKYGFKVIFDLNGSKRVKNQNYKEIIELVNTYESFSVIDMWYLYDEPDNDGIKVAQLNEYYDLIKKISNKPIIVTHAWTKNWYTYKQDVLMYDIYPIYNEVYPSNEVSKFYKFTNAILKLYRPDEVVPIIQFFNWESIKKDSLKEGLSYSSEFRYPSKIELRYFTFYAISKGIYNIGYYSLARSLMNSKNWYNDVGLKVIKEADVFLKEMFDYKRQEIYILKDMNIDITLWEDKKGSTKCIMFINNSNIRQELERSFIKENFGIDRIGNEKKMNKRLNSKIIFEPWDVIIYKM